MSFSSLDKPHHWLEPWARIVALLIVGGGIGLCPSMNAQPSSIGQWSSAQTWPYRPVHAQTLPTGKAMFWDSYTNADHPQLWGPATNSWSAQPHAGCIMFFLHLRLFPGRRL